MALREIGAVTGKKHLTKSGKRLFRLGLLALIAIVILVATSGGSGKSAKVTHTVSSVFVLDPQHVRVFVRWGNTGNAAGTASCTMNVTAYSPFGDEIGSGFDSTSPNNPVRPGAYEVQYQDIVITGNNAAGVTGTQDVAITGC